MGPARGSSAPSPSEALPHPPTFLGDVGPAWRQAASPVPGGLHQALGGCLLQTRAALPPDGLPPPQAELALSSGSRWGAALLVPGKTVETKNRQLTTGPTLWAARSPQPPRSQCQGVCPRGRRAHRFLPCSPQFPSHGSGAPPTPPPSPTYSEEGPRPRARADRQRRRVAQPLTPGRLSLSPRPGEPPTRAGVGAKETSDAQKGSCHQHPQPSPKGADLTAPPPRS